MSDKRYLGILTLTILLLISIPYLIGFQSGNFASQFGGFLINPVDGHSYLAKMQQGFRGDWKFKLPYSADQGEGAYLFLFYLMLGHIGRLTQIPLIFIFHGARLLSALWLLIVIYQTLKELYRENHQAIKIGMALIALGSGMGWLAVLAGAFTSDMWVAEAYPFLSMYTNPHFCLGLGLMIYILLPKVRENILINVVLGIFIGIVQPFGVVIIGLIKIIDGGMRIFQEKTRLNGLMKERWVGAILGFCLSGGLVITCQFWAILSDPILSKWHQQNITIKPSLIDLVISFSPCLILGIIGARKAWKNQTGRALVLWGGVCLGLVFIPWGLQRRFLTGVFFPLAALSLFGLQAIKERTNLKHSYLVIGLFFLAIPTNLVVLTSGVNAITEKNPRIFVDGDLISGLDWIKENTVSEALVLANEKDGLYIPSYTGRRVIYGHPYETVQAEAELAWLDKIFYEPQAEGYYNEVLEERGVDYVLIDSQAVTWIENWLVENWSVAYQSNEIKIYAK